jgi:RimJ/RimL family protein N-acetyltransferase
MSTTPPPIEPVELRAGDLLLRLWREDDVDAYWAALQDPVIRHWWASGDETRDDVVAILARRRDWSTGNHASWAVVGAGDDRLLGSVSLHRIDLDQRDAEIGYWTVPAARRRGVAARAVDTAVRWAFAELGVQRVQLFHAVENTASAGVARKAGFVQEGRLRRSHRYGDGQWHDELLWGRLTDDPVPLDREPADI